MLISKRIFDLETETAFTVLAKATKLQSEGKDIINLGIGQPDFATPSNIVEAAIKALKDGHHGYTPSNGIIELREAVSKYIYKVYSTDVSPENILISIMHLAWCKNASDIHIAILNNRLDIEHAICIWENETVK